MPESWENEEVTADVWGAAAKKTPAKPAKAKAAARFAASSSASATLNLLQLCEPLFQYVCRLNRSAKKSRSFASSQVRAEIKSLLANAKAKAVAAGPAASGQPTLVQQWSEIEPVMLFFIDFMIRSSALPFAMDWEDLSYELKKEMAGDEKFFDLLDLTLADKSDAASERLAIFYTCVGLGFTGFYTGQPEYLRKKMLECSSRIRHMLDADPNSKICPDAYEHVNVANLIESAGASLIGIGIALVGLAIVLFVANGYWYRNTANLMKQRVSTISDSVQASPPKLLPDWKSIDASKTNPNAAPSTATQGKP